MERWPKGWLASSPGRMCPKCKTKTGRPIMWGMPAPSVIEALNKGEIDVGIGGCVVSGDDPTHLCTTCGARFGTRRRRKTSGREPK